MRVYARCALLAVLVPAAVAQGSATLHATLDLREAVAAGWLDPAAGTVGLRGGTAPLSWGTTTPALDPDGDGLYTLSVPFVVRGDSQRVELKIKVDDGDAPNGGWQQGPNRSVTLRPGADTDLVLAWGDRPVLPPPTITGHVETLPGVAGAGLAARDIHVYLPPGYAEGDRRYPVLYLHDGASVFGTEAGSEWGMDEAAQALIEAGEIGPLILVGVANTDRRIDEYTPTVQNWRHVLTRVAPPADTGRLGALTGTFVDDGDTLEVTADAAGLIVDVPGEGDHQRLEALDDGRFFLPQAGITFAFERDASGAVAQIVATKPSQGGLGDTYGAFLIDTVKPMVDARYRTLPDAAHTGLGGSSLGGLITMHLGATRPDVFGRLLVASPSVWWDGRVLLATVAATTPPPGQRVWVDIGTEEGEAMVPDARRLAELLVETGWDPALVRYVEAEGGGHETRAWQARAPDMLRFLFPPETR